MMSETIGVVGGLGPYAGIDLCRKVFDLTAAESDQQHLDLVMVSLPASVPDRTEFLLGEPVENPAAGIVKVLRRLERAGARVVGMPCNTAHAAPIFDRVLDELREAGSEVRLLHMIREVSSHLRARHPSVRKVGLLATTGTVTTGVYDAAIEPTGVEVIRPDDGVQQGRVHPAIYDRAFGIKARMGAVTDESRSRIEAALDHLVERGAEAVILGCTELPLALPHLAPRDVPLLDSTEILARALIREAAPDRLRE
jgi:aspartate racemase